MGIGQGQQMQNPQMGQPGGGFMGGQRMGQMPQDAMGGRGSSQDPRMMGQMPQGGMFGQGGTSMMTNPNMGGQIAPMQVGQQVGGGSNQYAQQAMALEAQRLMQQAQQMPPQGGMQGGGGMGSMRDRMAGIGGLFFGNGNGGGMNYTGGSRDFDETGGANRPGTQGPGDGFAPRGPYPINDGNVMPPGAGYPPPTNTTMPLPRRRPDNVLVSKPPGDLPGRGMPPGYGPTKGPIDGRKLRDMMDITKRRQMDFDLKNRGGGGLPGSARDGIPPSLNRPSRLTK
jgi:hypothetical protein